jgi:DNA polymerase I-like protein with 3'-5' exonuclease and polymerase domains
LYGGVSDEDRKIPFFDKVDKFIHKMNEEAVRNGFVTTPKGRKIPLEWIEQPNAQKFFNYILQATETEFNIEVLKKLVENDTIPILYTYDSFLFELSDKNQVEGIKAVLESYGFPVRMDVGNNYSEV